MSLSTFSELFPTLTSSADALLTSTSSTTIAQATIFAPATTSLSSSFSVSSPTILVVPVTSSIRPAVVPAAPLEPFRPGNPMELIPSSMPTLDVTPFLSPSSNNNSTSNSNAGGTAGSTTDGANNPASLTNQKGPNGLSTSNIYGIVLGVLLASFILGFLVFVVRIKLRNNKQKDIGFNTEDADRLVADDAQEDRMEKDRISPTSDLSPIVRDEEDLEPVIVAINPW